MLRVHITLPGRIPFSWLCAAPYAVRLRGVSYQGSPMNDDRKNADPAATVDLQSDIHQKTGAKRRGF